MRGGRAGPALTLLAVLGLLAAGLARLFELEFSGGVAYGPGSSLRADREGAMIFYESLEAVPGLKVWRTNEPLEKSLKDVEPAETVLILLNAWPSKLAIDPGMVEFVRAGGTVVASPRGRNSSREWEAKLPEEEKDPEELEELDVEERDEETVAPLDLDIPALKYFGMSGPDAETGRVRGTAALPPGAPATLDWPASMVFDMRRREEDGPTVLYTLDEEPVVLAFRSGKGRILLLVDAFPFSNEAMYIRRNSDWFAWLIGDAREVVFEEHHFGFRRPNGLAAFLWSHRLQGLVFGLGLPFLLLLWHGAAPLLPPLTPEEEAAADVSPQSRLSGLRDLLVRHVPASNLLSLCAREWKTAFLRTEAERKRFGFLGEQADNILSDPDFRKSSPLSAGYQRLHDILTQKRTRL